jgi:hypothetical protein
MRSLSMTELCDLYDVSRKPAKMGIGHLHRCPEARIVGVGQLAVAPVKKMNNKRSLSLLLLLSTGCVSNRGFRFHGEYEAKESGYSIQLISQGYLKPGDDLANSAFALVQVCALPGFMGLPFVLR